MIEAPADEFTHRRGLPLCGGRQFAKGHDRVMVLAFSECEYILGI